MAGTGNAMNCCRPTRATVSDGSWTRLQGFHVNVHVGTQPSSFPRVVDNCGHSIWVGGVCPQGQFACGFQAITAKNAWDTCSGSGAGVAMKCCEATPK